MRRSPTNLSEVVKSPMSEADGCATKKMVACCTKRPPIFQGTASANTAAAAFNRDLFRIVGQQQMLSKDFKEYFHRNPTPTQHHKAQLSVLGIQDDATARGQN